MKKLTVISSLDFAGPETLSACRLGRSSVREIVWWFYDAQGAGLHFPHILTAVWVTGQYLRHLITDKIAMILVMAACTQVCVLSISVYSKYEQK